VLTFLQRKRSSLLVDKPKFSKDKDDDALKQIPNVLVPR
jgi:hypothetical protein